MSSTAPSCSCRQRPTLMPRQFCSSSSPPIVELTPLDPRNIRRDHDVEHLLPPADREGPAIRCDCERLGGILGIEPAKLAPGRRRGPPRREVLHEDAVHAVFVLTN